MKVLVLSTHQIKQKKGGDEDTQDAAEGRVEDGGRFVAAGGLGQDDGRGDWRWQAAQRHQPDSTSQTHRH